MNPAARGANDELVNLALIGMVAAFALALVLRVAATTAAVATGTTTPERLADCLRALKVEAPSAAVWQEIRRVADLVMGWSSDRSESGRIADGRPG